MNLRNHTFRSGLLVAIALAVPVCSFAQTPSEPLLLHRAQRIATLRGADVRWAICLPSGESALYFKDTDSHDYSIVKRNLRTGIDTPLNALNKLHNNSLDYGFEVSPDGNRLLWQNGQEEIHWATLDGLHHGLVKSKITNKVHWMADSRHWVEFVDKFVFEYTKVIIHDIEHPTSPRTIDVLPTSPLAHTDHRGPPVTFDNVRFTQQGHLLIGLTRQSIEVMDFDLERQGLLTNQSRVALAHDVGLSSIAISPDGQHIAWFVRHGKRFLGVSKLDGSEMQLVGSMEITTKDPTNPDSPLSADPTTLRWTADGQYITFVYQNALYRVPARGTDANASLAFQTLVSETGAGTSTGRNLAESLFRAARGADPAWVQRLVASGAPINNRDSDGETALFIAAENGNTEVVRKLLADGADPNLRDKWGDTALIKSIEKFHDETALLLLANGARTNIKGYFERTALLVECEKSTDPRDRTGPDGTPVVIRQPSVTLVAALLDRGADPNLAGYEGKLPLGQASWTGSLPVVQLLLTRGAKVNARDAHGYSALNSAVIRKSFDLSKYLLEHGADPNTQEAEGKTNGETPLLHATYQGNMEICKLLISHGANVNKADPAGYTPLSNAVAKGDIEIVRYLLDKGANPNTRMIDSTILIEAVLRMNTSIVELLLQRKANINAKGAYFGSGNAIQKTALGWALHEHLDEMVRLLKQAGAKE